MLAVIQICVVVEGREITENNNRAVTKRVKVPLTSRLRCRQKNWLGSRLVANSRTGAHHSKGWLRASRNTLGCLEPGTPLSPISMVTMNHRTWAHPYQHETLEVYITLSICCKSPQHPPSFTNVVQVQGCTSASERGEPFWQLCLSIRLGRWFESTCTSYSLFVFFNVQ